MEPRGHSKSFYKSRIRESVRTESAQYAFKRTTGCPECEKHEELDGDRRLLTTLGRAPSFVVPLPSLRRGPDP